MWKNRSVGEIIAAVIATVVILAVITMAFGPKFLPRAGQVTLDKVEQLCLDPRGC